MTWEVAVTIVGCVVGVTWVVAWMMVKIATNSPEDD